jgi:hypothetical protein
MGHAGGSAHSPYVTGQLVSEKTGQLQTSSSFDHSLFFFYSRFVLSSLAVQNALETKIAGRKEDPGGEQSRGK